MVEWRASTTGAALCAPHNGPPAYVWVMFEKQRSSQHWISSRIAAIERAVDFEVLDKNEYLPKQTLIESDSRHKPQRRSLGRQGFKVRGPRNSRFGARLHCLDACQQPRSKHATTALGTPQQRFLGASHAYFYPHAPVYSTLMHTGRHGSP
jgi:hypothetical protein